MTVESGTSIGDLDPSKPGPSDPKSEGDDHLRLIKSLILASFPNIKGAMTVAHDQVASLTYVQQTAFSAALPGQPGGAVTYNLTSTNGVAAWQPTKAIFDDTNRLAQAQATALSF